MIDGEHIADHCCVVASAIGRAALTGADLTALLAVVPNDVSAGGVWPVLRVGTGQMLRLAWRYPLPDE